MKEPRHVEQEEEPAPESGGVIENFREVWRQEDRSGVMILAAIFFWFVAWNAMEAFFTLYAVNVLGVGVGNATMMLTAFAAALILFAIPSGYIATALWPETNDPGGIGEACSSA